MGRVAGMDREFAEETQISRSYTEFTEETQSPQRVGLETVTTSLLFVCVCLEPSAPPL
jgi:hypothetical protein